MDVNKLGTLFIVAAPSGGGKTSLVSNLVEALSGIAVSISHTTRPMRPGEREGVDYFFVSQSEFNHMVAANDFIEHAQVFDNCYGTSRAQIDQRLAQGIDIVLDIDWQGAAQIRSLFKNSVSIFILPPSLEVLRERLLLRGQDNATIIADRMHKAQDEMSHYREFEYLIINDDFAQAAAELQAIVVANRLKLGRQEQKQAKLLSFLMA